MDPDITININLPSGGARLMTADGADQAGAAPPPAAMEQLAISASADAPAPSDPAALEQRTVSASTAGDSGSGPPPLDIEQLTTSMAGQAPQPMAFGSADEFAAGAPSPSLQASDLAAGNGGAPEPMPLSELTETSSGGRGSRKK